MISTRWDRREWRVTATSGNNGGRMAGFTLLEIIIALVLVAILVSASLPYLFDSFAGAEGDRASEAIAKMARESRTLAMEKGERQRLVLTASGVRGLPLPEGWILEVKGLNDDRFHPPGRDQSWDFSTAGSCEPLALRLSKGDRAIVMTFDALTAQPLHEDE